MTSKQAMLSWETPKKLHTTEEHNAQNSSDCGVPGTYVPNMSEEDMQLYKAKKVGGNVPRIEVRKTIEGSQVLVKVKASFPFPPPTWSEPSWKSYIEHGTKNVKISANGPINMTFDEWETFVAAVNEAIEEAKLRR